MMKRRQFLKSVFGIAAGLVVAPSVVKAGEKPVWLVSERVSLSLADEDLDMLRRLEANQPDGAYLETSEIKCLRCGHITKLSKGYYAFGTQVKCECGNRSMFMAICKVVNCDN